MNYKGFFLIFFCICISAISFANGDSTVFNNHHSAMGLYFTPSVLNHNIDFRLSWKAGVLYEHNFTSRLFLRTGIAHSIYKTIYYSPGTTNQKILSDDQFLFFENPFLAGFYIVKKGYGNLFFSAGLVNLILYKKKEVSLSGTVRAKKKLEYGLLFQTSMGGEYTINSKFSVFVEPVLIYIPGYPFLGISFGLKNNF